jgi:sarcosine oxidase subunit gamma
MLRTRHLLEPRSPFSTLPVPARTGDGVRVADRDGLRIASVLARKKGHVELAESVRQRWGIELPRGPCRRAAGPLAFVGVGLDAWLAVHEPGDDGFADSLVASIGNWACISDQSDGYAVLRISGPCARDTLCKLVPIDLHPRAFRVDQVASTVAHHLGVTLWRLGDEPGGVPVFEIALFRSCAASFWHSLAESAAEFGICAAWADPGA